MSINWLQRWDNPQPVSTSVLPVASFENAEEAMVNLAEFCQITLSEAQVLSAYCGIRQRRGDLYLNRFAEEAELSMPPNELCFGMEGLLERGFLQLFPANSLERPDVICLSASAEAALKFNRKDALPFAPEDPSKRAVLQAYVKSVCFRNQLMTLEDWEKFSHGFLSQVKAVPFSRIVESKVDKSEHALALFFALLDHVECHSYPLKLIARLFCKHPIDIAAFRHSVFSESHSLIKEGLLCIESSTDSDFLLRFTASNPNPMEKKYTRIHDFSEPVQSPVQKIEHAQLSSKSLFLNSYAEETLNDLKRLTRKSAFARFKKQMLQAGEVPGLTVLLYGPPGTGKTETVKQWALETGRDLVFFDVAQQRDKWYGQSEKNLDSVFTEYRQMLKEQPHAPILVFNEADAVFQQRDSLDGNLISTENAMQTILLQHLEQFQGILVATTNRPHAMDLAFERRFLYKIELGIPSLEVRQRMLIFFFPDLPKSTRESLAKECVFTGADLASFKKQMLVKQLLKPQKTFPVSDFTHFLKSRNQVMSPSFKVGFHK
jgi:hypothetical protein